jgi:hypothetical protein
MKKNRTVNNLISIRPSSVPASSCTHIMSNSTATAVAISLLVGLVFFGATACLYWGFGAAKFTTDGGPGEHENGGQNEDIVRNENEA